MDLGTVQMEDGMLSLTVKHPITGEDTDGVLQMLSPFSVSYLKRKNALARDVLWQAMSGDAKHELELRLTAAAIAGWSGLTQDDEPLTYSAQAAEEVLVKHPWLREQIIFFYTDATKFFKIIAAS